MWADRFDWTPIAAEESRAATGGLVIQSGRLVKGRPITLKAEQSCWIPQAKLIALHTLAERGEPFTLVRGSYTAQVMFRYSEPPVIEAQTLFPNEDTEEAGSDQIMYELTTLKLIEV
ncbi:hypothetical protein MM188_003222 [Vibrio cholerae]|nr:hypothetical protein [Vibrio cholerae]